MDTDRIQKHPNHLVKTDAKGAFTILEYIEFTSAEEFRRFRDLEPVTEAEIENVDWDELLDSLGAA